MVCIDLDTPVDQERLGEIDALTFSNVPVEPAAFVELAFQFAILEPAFRLV